MVTRCRLSLFFVCSLLAVAPAAAENLIANGAFHQSIGQWNHQPPASGFEKSWSPVDAQGDIYSGSALITVVTPEPLGAHGLVQCANGVVGGQTYTLSGEVFLPAAQDRTGVGYTRMFWYDLPNCTQTGVPLGDFSVGTVGAWTGGSVTVTAPANAESVWVELGASKNGPSGGTFRAHYDNFELCRPALCDAGSEEGWLTTADFPDFRFRVTVSPDASTHFFGKKVGDCIPDAICVSGALANRVEALLRLIGPRPNGYLWVQAVRFTPSRLDLEVHQISTGVIKSYALDPIGPDEDRLEGLVDRLAFLP